MELSARFIAGSASLIEFGEYSIDDDNVALFSCLY